MWAHSELFSTHINFVYFFIFVFFFFAECIRMMYDVVRLRGVCELISKILEILPMKTYFCNIILEFFIKFKWNGYLPFNSFEGGPWACSSTISSQYVRQFYAFMPKRVDPFWFKNIVLRTKSYKENLFRLVYLHSSSNLMNLWSRWATKVWSIQNRKSLTFPETDNLSWI